MRIRKEISKWSFKTFAILATILLIIFNLFTLVTAYMDKALNDVNLTHFWVMSVSYPILLASILTTGFRTGSLYINDFSRITDFQSKLKAKILLESMVIESESENQTHYRPTHWFTKLFNSWSGAEKLSVQWGEEVIIRGSLKRVSNLEDILTWNKDFKK